MTDPPRSDTSRAVTGRPHPWDTLVGPFYDDLGVARLLRITPETLSSHVESGAVLCTVTHDGSTLYPRFQFQAGELLPHLREVLSALLQAGRDNWGHAQWLNAPVDRYGGHSAATMLRDGHAQRVITDAVRDAKRWTQ